LKDFENFGFKETSNEILKLLTCRNFLIVYKVFEICVFVNGVNQRDWLLPSVHKYSR